jgi:DNA-binding NarL/FixJ family response regulator
MLLIDNDRRYVEANTPARLAFRQSLEEMRKLRVDDLTPDYFLPTLEEYWSRMTSTGVVAGPYVVASPAGTSFHVVYCAVADALPGLHLIVFAPSGWAEFEAPEGDDSQEPAARLTPRELEVLQLAAEGRSGPLIAETLVVSPATVRTHFENIYAKLGMSDRAGSVAKAMRLGLIE